MGSEISEPLIMGHDDQRGLRASGRLLKEPENAAGVDVIEARRRLICEDEQRRVDHSPSHGDSLGLPLRQSVNGAIGKITDTHRIKRPLDHAGIPREASTVSSQYHILGNRQPRNEIGLLQDESDGAPTPAIPFGRGEERQVASAEPEMSIRDHAKTAEQVKKCGLPAPRRTLDKPSGARGHVQVRKAEARAAREGEVNVSSEDHGRW